MGSADANSNTEKAGRYYELFVMALVVLFFAVLTVRLFATRPRGTARWLRAHGDIYSGLKTSLEVFKGDCGRFPTTEEGWSVLANPPKDGSLTNWHGPYLDQADALEDPWGHAYVYGFPAAYSTNGYDLYSLGPDGVGNTADDINNWDKPYGERGLDGDELYQTTNELLLVIPVLFGFRVVVEISSRKFRTIALQNRLVDWLWFAISIGAFWIVLLMPRIVG